MIDLHHHFDGAFDVAALYREAQRRNLPQGKLGAAEFASRCRVPENCNTLTDFLAVFFFFYDIAQDLDFLYNEAAKLPGRMSEGGVIYLETRFGPHLFTGTQYSPEQVTEAVVSVEEKCAELYGLGKIRGFLHLYIGEEAVAVGAIPLLTSEDAIVATYREHGHALVRGIPPEAVMAEMFGKTTGCSGGRGGSMHLFDAKRRFFGGNAIVAGGLPLAVGLALADKLQRRSRVTMCLFGDGAVAEGEFHESLNLAALWKLPVLFLCENNLYAMGTHIARYQSSPDLIAKAAAYGMPAASVDGMSILAVRAATDAAIAHVRAGNGPYFLEAQTYRFRAHSMYDAELYRSKEEVSQWKERDPINIFLAQLRQRPEWSENEFADSEERIAQKLTAAVAAAEAGPWEPVEDLERDVYAPEAASSEVTSPAVEAA